MLAEEGLLTDDVDRKETVLTITKYVGRYEGLLTEDTGRYEGLLTEDADDSLLLVRLAD